MAANAVLNIRLPEDLKRHGNQVLDKNNVSISQVVRDLYKYMETEQDIPSFAKPNEDSDKFERRRRLLETLDKSPNIPDDLDLKRIKGDRLMKKYGERP